MQPAVAQPPPPPTPSVGAVQQNAFTVGQAIARTFSTWGRHLLVFSLLTLIAYVPLVLVSLLGDVPVPGITAPSLNPLDPNAAAAAAPVAPGAGLLLAYVAMMLLFLVEIGAITQGVLTHLAGKPVSFGGMVAAGLRRALPLLGVGVLSYLIIVVGTILLVVPGVIFACALAVAIPAVVVERPGVFGAIKRSFALTKGNRLAILAVFFVLGLVAMGVAMVGSFLLPQLTASFAPMLGTLLGLVLNAAFGTLFWVGPAVVYHDLRVAKEGVATAQLAAVFE